MEIIVSRGQSLQWPTIYNSFHFTIAFKFTATFKRNWSYVNLDPDILLQNLWIDMWTTLTQKEMCCWIDRLTFPLNRPLYWATKWALIAWITSIIKNLNQTTLKHRMVSIYLMQSSIYLSSFCQKSKKKSKICEMQITAFTTKR